jgi:hypothetical protein
MMMARSRIPNALARRHLMDKQMSDAQALQLAEAYLAEGRSIEALDFLARANASARLLELRSGALESGDVFLLRATARAMAEPPTRDEWSAIAVAAAAAGRELDAASARRQLERGDAD